MNKNILKLEFSKIIFHCDFIKLELMEVIFKGYPDKDFIQMGQN